MFSMVLLNGCPVRRSEFGRTHLLTPSAGPGTAPSAEYALLKARSPVQREGPPLLLVSGGLICSPGIQSFCPGPAELGLGAQADARLPRGGDPGRCGWVMAAGKSLGVVRRLRVRPYPPASLVELA